jgi:hypothetical protein
MATMTYATLTQDIKDWMENDGTEFSNETDNFIGLAEQRIVRDIDPQAFTKSAFSSFNVNDRFVTKPTDALVIRHLLYLDSNSKRHFLDLQIYSSRYKASVDSINNQARRRRRDDYNAPMNVLGENNIQQATT